jgi:hypothetical protein
MTVCCMNYVMCEFDYIFYALNYIYYFKYVHVLSCGCKKIYYHRAQWTKVQIKSLSYSPWSPPPHPHGVPSSPTPGTASTPHLQQTDFPPSPPEIDVKSTIWSINRSPTTINRLVSARGIDLPATRILTSRIGIRSTAGKPAGLPVMRTD